MKSHLWRILGNDLPKRHHPKQTHNNIKFILENEPEFPNTEKKFFLNRLVDKEKYSCYIDLLLKSGKPFVVDPFIPDQYSQLTTLDAKIQYLTNLNQARNRCLEMSKEEGADYIFPLDGASFLRQDLVEPIFETIKSECPPYIAIPQARLHTYEQVIDTTSKPSIYEDYVFNNQIHSELRELTLAFSKFHDIQFNPDLQYGNVDKVELLWRLGLSGHWDRWCPEIRKQSLKNSSIYSGTVPIVGTIIRLPDGLGPMNNKERGRRRLQGLKELVILANRASGKS